MGMRTAKQSSGWQRDALGNQTVLLRGLRAYAARKGQEDVLLPMSDLLDTVRSKRKLLERIAELQHLLWRGARMLDENRAAWEQHYSRGVMSAQFNKWIEDAKQQLRKLTDD